MRTISLNAQYIFLFKNPRDNSQFAHLARQLYPHNYRFAVDAYKNSTQDTFGYLLIDLRNEQDEELRLRISGRTTDRLRADMSRHIRQYMPILKKILVWAT